MSSRWPQGQQDQRSSNVIYDEDWPQDGDGAQPWQDPGWQDAGWQDPDSRAYPGQWTPAEAAAQPQTPAAAQEPAADAAG